MDNPLYGLRRRRFNGALLASTLAAVGAPFAQTQPPLRVLCGYPAGGSVDVVSRKLAEKLGARFARTVIVDNRPGAAGRLAVTELKKEAPDGATMVITPASVLTMYPHVYRQLAYDPFVDLAPVATVAATGFALAIGPLVPTSVATLEDFVRWCRAQPAPVTCGNAGAGSMPHFMALLAAKELGAEWTHVPYRGGLLAMQSAAAGEIAVALATESAARPLQQAGKLRVLATSWADASPFFPQAPTFAKAGLKSLTQREWFGAFVPAKTSPAVVQSLADAVRDALGEPDVRETWEKLSLVVESNTPAQLASALRSEHDFWGPLVRGSGFTPES
jgi:tripartite-type tricarboxylate transporter receptor subunit TctC